MGPSTHYAPGDERAAPGLHDSIEGFLGRRGLVSGKRIIDVGAGTGAWARRLLKAGAAHVTGFDHDEIASDDPRFETRTADFNRPGWANGVTPGDLVTCIEVVEHIPNQLVFLEGLYSLLAADGRLVMTTPNLETPRTRMRLALTGKLKEFDPEGDPTHFMPIFIYPFRKVCAQAGLEIDEIWSSPESGARNVGIRGRVADRLASAGGAQYIGDSLCFLMRRA